MTGQNDFDRRVRAWLEPGPSVLSDIVLDAARAEVHLTRQRHALRLPRRNPMTQSSRLLLAAFGGLAAIIIVGLGLKFVSSNTAIGDPVPSSLNGPSTAPSAVPTSALASPTLAPSPTTTQQVAFPKVPKQASAGSLPLAWKASGPPTSKAAATGAPVIDPAGRIWVPSGLDSKFWIFSPAGKFLESWGKPGPADGQFDFVTASGGARQAYGGIAFAADGSFWVADTGNHRVQHFDKDRVFLESLGDAALFDMPVAIAIDVGGDIFIDDAGRREIQEYNQSLAHVLTFASGVAGPYLSENNGWIGTNALPDGRPGFTEYKPDATYQGSLDLSAVCQYPAGSAQSPNGDLFIACMTSPGADGQPDGVLMVEAGNGPYHFWSTGGAGIAVSTIGDAIYITIPGSPDLTKYTLPARP
jgi:hypothetical protein